MKYFGILLMTVFVSVSVFGVFGMHTAADMNMAGRSLPCIGSAANGTDCPMRADPLDFAAFHLNALRNFSLANLGGNLITTLLVVFVYLLLAGLTFISRRLFKLQQQRPAFYRYRLRDNFFTTQKRQFTRWLALHENSPATI